MQGTWAIKMLGLNSITEQVQMRIAQLLSFIYLFIFVTSLLTIWTNDNDMRARCVCATVPENAGALSECRFPLNNKIYIYI